MKSLTQKLSKRFFGVGVRVVTLALFLVVFGASAALAQTRGYVTNINSNTVSVIDPATNTVVATIPAGTTPLGIAVTPNGSFAYVTNPDSNNVSVISAASNTVVATVPVGSGPVEIAITPNGAFAYVVNLGDNTVSVINTATNLVTATISAPLFVTSIAITPNGAFAYAAGFIGPFGQGVIAVIDTATNMVTATVSVGAFLGGVAIAPNGAFVYVVDAFNVYVVSTATNAVVATVPIGNSPSDIAITPNGAFAYVTKSSGNSVAVIDTATNSVVATVPVGTNPSGVAITPNGAFAYVVNRVDNNVSVINTATNTVVATIPVGTAPRAIAFGALDNCAIDALYKVIAGPQGQRNEFTGTVGSKFTVGANVFVDKLGFEDQLLNGLASTHQVGLWNSSGTLLASVTVQSGTGSLLIGNWRYETLPTPVKLTAGSTYIVGAQVTNGGDKWTDNGNFPIEFAINQGFSLGSPPNVFSSGGFALPTLNGTLAALRWAPANLLFTACPITLVTAQVQNLINAGTLTQNQGAGLIDKLNQVSAKLDQDQTGAACSQLNSFIQQVNAFINSGSLSQAQGQALIDAANAIKADNGCP
jgi:YVTN family beta-propeller protein